MDSPEIGRPVTLPWRDPRLTPRWWRLHAWGSAAIVLWIVGCFALMIGSVTSHWGPFGWIATLQIRLLGHEGPVVGALPGLLLMGVPGVIVSRMAKTVDRPFLFGMQDAVDIKRSPRLEPRPRDRRRMLTAWMRGALAVGIASLILLGVGWWRVAALDAAPRAALPTLSLGQATSGAKPPALARVEGVGAFPDLRWTHDTAVRRTLYRDVYFPLSPTGWTPGQPVRLVEWDRTLPNDAPGPDNQVDAPGPREGVLRPLDDPWLAQRLAEAGMKLADRVVVLERKPLHGMQPPPGDSALVVSGVVVLVATAFSALVFAWAAWLARRRLPTLVDDDGASTRRSS